MPKVSVFISPWDSIKIFNSDFKVKKGDRVIVPTENGNELGVVVKEDEEIENRPESKVIRLADDQDIKICEKQEKEKKTWLAIGRQEAKKKNLPIKVIDARTNLENKQVVFIFTADGRIDFRDLVKVLASQLKKTIRMQQVGSRDEARRLGGYGICGRELCCVKFPGSLPSISTDMARIQQIAHRGTERISGLCGRLMCCLAYEAEQYKKLLEGMPELYSIVNTNEGKGTVIEVNPIEQEIKVKTEKGKYLMLNKKDLK